MPVSSDDYETIRILRSLCILITILLTLREFAQLWASWKRYLKSSENYLEMAIIVSSIFVLTNDGCIHQEENLVCQMFSVLLVLSSSLELLLLLGRHPRFSTQVEIFRRVTLNYLKFWSYLFLIIGFATSFRLVFRTCDPSICGTFDTYANSIFKSIVMSTGELEASDLTKDSYNILSQILIIAFIFFIVIVLVNLLNALAVDDSKKIRDDAYVN